LTHLHSAAAPTYLLGHTTDELNRLIEQGRFFGDLTEHILTLAGLGAGMRVLDIGCGTGDVSFLAARLVGKTGSVIGVDRSAEAIQVAEQRATRAGLTNVRFLTADLAELVIDEPVDALVGRLILLYLAEPAGLLRRLSAFVKPDGIIAFQELTTDGAISEPRCPLYELTGERIIATFERAGADPRAGLKLSRYFVDAGLPAPQMLLSGRVEQGLDSDIYEWLTQLTRTLLPVMQRSGVATAEEVEIDTLASRLRAEAVALNAVLVAPPFIGAWARIAGA
jgi:ubiquinone/menaquinone biosynthesis C-methylase UbiE